MKQLNGMELAGKQLPLVYPMPNSGSLAEEVSIEQAIQENLLCFASLKDGFFTDRERVIRLGLINGAGQSMQTGGNKVSDR
jgi:hypothetical protein